MNKFILNNNYIYHEILLTPNSIFTRLSINLLNKYQMFRKKHLLIRERKKIWKIVALIIMTDNEGRQKREASDKFEEQTFPFPDRGPLITLRMIFCFLYLLQSKLQPSSIPFDSLGKPHHIAIHPLVSRSPCLPY